MQSAVQSPVKARFAHALRKRHTSGNYNHNTPLTLSFCIIQFLIQVTDMRTL